MSTSDRSLSRREAKLILELEWQAKRVITLTEIETALRIGSSDARFVAHRLVQKGWLERLRPGFFQLIPADRGREAVADTNPFVITDIFNHPCFYSAGTACSFYGFTDQIFAELFLVTSKHRQPIDIRGKKYRFAFVPKKRFFGFEDVQVFGRSVKMATQERAILDSVNRPDLSGGLAEVSRIIGRAAPKLDYERLTTYLGLWGQSALVQRLGFLLDLNHANLSDDIRAELKALVKPSNKIYLTSRRKSSTRPKYNAEWFIIENIPREQLLEGSATNARTFFKKRLPIPGSESQRKLK